MQRCFLLRFAAVAILGMAGALSAARLCALTCDYSGQNDMVHISSATGELSVVKRNFPTWDIPDASFDTASNTFWAVMRVHHGSEQLKLVAYNATSGSVLSEVQLPSAYKPDNINGAHFEGVPELVHLLHTPYNETTSHFETFTVSVSAKSGQEVQRIPMPVAGLVDNMGSDAFDAQGGRLFHLWTDSTTTKKVLSVVDVRRPAASPLLLPTNLSRYGYLADPVFVAGRMLGVDAEGHLAALDVSTGSMRRVSRVAMLNGPGPWHGVTDGQLLFITNTTQGEPPGRSPAPVRIRTPARRDADNTTLLVFDLSTGDVVRSTSLARPITWMGLLH